MTHPSKAQGSLWSGAMVAVLSAQFLSAAADNALLFAAIGLVKARGYPDYFESLLQEFFAGAYILLAPFVGPLSDAFAKGRVMLVANSIKLLGALAMFAGLHPLLAYGLVGLGAAAYSPAKYGILSEMVAPQRLVQANSLMEGSTIVAILLGALLGGWLADVSVGAALGAVALLYAAAAVANVRIPHVPGAHPLRSLDVRALSADFGRALNTLWRDYDARFSLIGTSLFWGSGSTLRFLLVAWVPVALGIHNNHTAANLNGVVAIGIALGAALAARWVDLRTVNRALLAGLMLGGCVYAFAGVSQWGLALGLLVATGACAGFYVVPLNALLQARGHGSVGAGHAIAAQNFGEGLAMLTMVGAFTAARKAELDVIGLAQGFGMALGLAMALLALARLTRWRHAP